MLGVATTLSAVVLLLSGTPLGTQEADGDTRAAPVAVSWSVEPAPVTGAPARPNFVFEAAPGEVIEDTLVVRNLGDVELVLGLYASDAVNTSSGGIDLLAAGERPDDVGSWVELARSSWTVPPGESIEVPFEVVVPSDAAPGDHAGGIVTSLRVGEQDAGGNRVDVERRLGSRVYVRVDGELRPELTFTELEARYRAGANPFAPGRMELTYRVENTGNVRLRATRSASVSPRLGPAAGAQAADMAELLPGNAVELTQTVSGVWPGMSTRSEVQLGPYEPAAGPGELAPAIARTSSTLVPWPQIVLVLVVLLALLVWWRTRRRRRRRLRTTVDAAVVDALRARTYQHQ